MANIAGRKIRGCSFPGKRLAIDDHFAAGRPDRFKSGAVTQIVLLVPYYAVRASPLSVRHIAKAQEEPVSFHNLLLARLVVGDRLLGLCVGGQFDPLEWNAASTKKISKIIGVGRFSGSQQLKRMLAALPIGLARIRLQNR